MAAIIIGHSQLRYFSNYISDPETFSVYDSGLRVEQLLSVPVISDSIKNVSVST